MCSDGGSNMDLTSEIVDTLTPPERGERWIPDQATPGFGVRLWATPSGSGKAFAIRVTDARGKVVRLTYQTSLAWFVDEDAPTLGWHLSSARRWAWDQINRLKGRPTFEELELRRRKQIAARRGKRTLQQEVDRVTGEMRKKKLSPVYIDRLDKLFAVHLSKDLKMTRISDISPVDLATALVNKQTSASNIRVLRSFLWRVVQSGPLQDLGKHEFSEDFAKAFWERWAENIDVRFPELRDLHKADYKRVFRRLESEKVYWQQALCIRLYFVFGAPLSRLMSAEWSQCLDDSWYPYFPNERVTWFMHRQRLDEAVRLLEKIRRLIRRDFGRSRYWFPSHHGRQVGHIRTVDSVWCNTLHDVGSRYYPLREFAMSFRPPSTPSYHLSVYRYSEAARRELEKEVQLSKRLNRQRKMRMDSGDCLWTLRQGRFLVI